MIEFKAQIRRKYPEIYLPTQANDTDVGYDIRSCSTYNIALNTFVTIRTGLIVKPPEGFHFEMALRSSMPVKYGLMIPNGMGIIDPKYCGPNDELMLPIYKFGVGSEDVYIPSKVEKVSSNLVHSLIKPGDRIAQLILRKTNLFGWEDITDTPFNFESRGGFGSTGVK
jgi:dUTP pyrophosphatase